MASPAFSSDKCDIEEIEGITPCDFMLVDDSVPDPPRNLLAAPPADLRNLPTPGDYRAIQLQIDELRIDVDILLAGSGGGGGGCSFIAGNTATAATGATGPATICKLDALNPTGIRIIHPDLISDPPGTPTTILLYEAYMTQWGAVSDNDQRFLGDKRIVDLSPDGGKGWCVGTFETTRGAAFPTNYTVFLPNSPQVLTPDTDSFTMGPNNWFWSENRSYGVINTVDPEAEGASAGSAAAWSFVPPRGTPGESYAGSVVTANAEGSKIASVLAGAGLVSPIPTEDGYAGYYPAYHHYSSAYDTEEAMLWVGADQTSTHSRIGMTRGFPGDRADGLLEFHFRSQSWEPDVPGEEEEDPPVPASASGDILISRLHIGLDDSNSYPGTTREPLHTWPDDDVTLPSPSASEGDLRYWVKRGSKLWPGLDAVGELWPSASKFPLIPTFAGGVLLGFSPGDGPLNGLFSVGGLFGTTYASAGSTAPMSAGWYLFIGSCAAIITGSGPDPQFTNYVMLARFWNVTQAAAASPEFGIAYASKTHYQVLSVNGSGVPTYAAPVQSEGYYYSPVCAVIEVNDGDVIELQAKGISTNGGTPVSAYIGSGPFGGGTTYGDSAVYWHRIR